MSTVISQRELRNDNGPILRAVVETGEVFVITRNGVPSAELRPLRKRPTFASRDAFVSGRLYASQRVNRLAELRADLGEVMDIELDQ
jgi:prevent-host-death family protein